jgi:L-rhamnose mutarotase
MPRIALKMKLFPNQKDEYKRRHDELWDEMKTLLKETGISDYSIALDEETNILFANFKIENPALLDELPKHPTIKRWWAYMADIMETNPDNSPVTVSLEEVFYLA